MSLSYINMLKKYRQRYNEREELRRINHKVAMEIDSLKSVRTCISLGTGYGDYDIDFIQICLPNLEKLIVVEKNSDCVEELKKNIKITFGDCFEVEIHEMYYENFMETYKGKNIDLIISFHSFYLLPPEDSHTFFDLCFNSWLDPDKGLLIYAIGSQTNDLETIIQQLGPNVNQIKYSEHIKNDIKSLSHRFLMEIPYHLVFDFRNYDDDLHGMLTSLNKIPFTQDTVKEAVMNAVPNGVGKFTAEFCVVSKCR